MIAWSLLLPVSPHQSRGACMSQSQAQLAARQSLINRPAVLVLRSEAFDRDALPWLNLSGEPEGDMRLKSDDGAIVEHHAVDLSLLAVKRPLDLAGGLQAAQHRETEMPRH